MARVSGVEVEGMPAEPAAAILICIALAGGACVIYLSREIPLNLSVWQHQQQAYMQHAARSTQHEQQQH